MDKALSQRKSSARNAYGKESTKGKFKVHVELSGCERAIDCNDRMFVVPWKVTGGGALACFSLDPNVEVPKVVPLLQVQTRNSLCDV
jgi:hypothetical protein